MIKEKDTKTFISEMINEFPEIRDEVMDDDYDGLVSLQIACFRRFTQKAINENKIDLIQRCIRFVEANIHAVAFEIENSMYLSYLGKLEIPNDQIKLLFPKNLLDAKAKLDHYYSTPSENPKVNEFLKRWG